MMKRFAIVYTALLMLFVGISTNVFAQVNATVGGTVSDASGALIPGVEVTAKNINTGIAATRLSNEAGNYEFPSLQPGVYTVSAAYPDFKPLRITTSNSVKVSKSA